MNNVQCDRSLNPIMLWFRFRDGSSQNSVEGGTRRLSPEVESCWLIRAAGDHPLQCARIRELFIRRLFIFTVPKTASEPVLFFGPLSLFVQLTAIARVAIVLCSGN